MTFSGSIGPIAAKLLEVTDLHRYNIGTLKQFFSLTRADAVEMHVGIPVGQMFGMTEGMVFAAAPTHVGGYSPSDRRPSRYRPATRCGCSSRGRKPRCPSARSASSASAARAP